MSDVANLNIVIGANVAQAEAGLNSVSKKLGETAVAAVKVDSSIGKSSQTFQNLGRVIQDLPYGFQGIQNNLTQLIPAAGLLGLAFTAVITAINFSQIGFQNWTRRAREAKEETDKFAESLKAAETSALATGVKLQSFVDIARDNTKSLQERNYALEQANKLMGEHGEKLTLVNINTAAATKEVESFTQALIQQAVAAKYADKAADLIIKQRDAAKNLDQAIKGLGTATKEYNEAVAQQTRDESFAAVSTYAKDRAFKGAIDATKAYTDATDQLRGTTKDLNLSTEEANKLLAELGTKPDVKKVKDLADAFHHVDTNIKDLRNANQIIIETGNALDAVQRNLNRSAALTPKHGLDDLIKGIQDNEAFKKLNEQMEASAKIVSSVQNAFDSLFNSIANGANVFDAIGGALKQLLVKLVATVIEAALLSVILNAIFPGLGAAGQFSFGNLFSQLAGLPKFAGGGVVTRPTLLIAGESGAEKITPLGATGSANNVLEGNVTFEIHGQTLRGILKRADRSANTFQ